MAYTNIDDPSAYFQAATYTGTGSSGNAITNDGNSDLQPDLVWIKQRNGQGTDHQLVDSTRGNTKYLYSNSTGLEVTSSDRLTSFNSDGFTLGADASNVVNQSGGYLYVGWQWKANGGTTSSNTNGTITSTVQANTDAGFNIVTFTGNGSNDATIGHGLGVTPAMIITKNRADSVSWRVWHKDLTSTYVLFLNSNNSQTSPTAQGNGYIKTVGSSTYSVYQGLTDTNGVNGSGDAMVSYCFAEKQGFSKFGKYVGNGSTTNGPFVYTGFKPAFVMIKAIDAGKDWTIFDNKRYYNGSMYFLYADTSAAEGESPSSGAHIDLLSNGFKIYDNWTLTNQNTVNYIYMAFAENPFVTSTGIPTTAR